jgi:starch synthase
MTRQVNELKRRKNGRVGVFIGFDDRMAHLVMAASDLVTLPSRYEPCGLTQMYAQKYGSVPIVHRTGGLADTVTDANENPNDGTGFLFSPLNEGALRGAVNQAIAILRNDPKRWSAIRARGMERSFSWKEAAKDYLRMYREIAPGQSSMKSDVLAPAVGK